MYWEKGDLNCTQLDNIKNLDIVCHQNVIFVRMCSYPGAIVIFLCYLGTTGSETTDSRYSMANAGSVRALVPLITSPLKASAQKVKPKNSFLDMVSTPSSRYFTESDTSLLLISKYFF